LAPQLKRHPLGSVSEYDAAEQVRSRRLRLLVRIAVGGLWIGGVVLAISSGFDPGPWWSHGPPRPWPYPLGQVLVEIAKITVVSAGLYDFLRPQPESTGFKRTVRALGVMFVTLVWVEMFSWTDQPGYAYATSNYVLLATALLLLAVIVHGIVRVIRLMRASSGSGTHAA
jgi:peptidoglycan/LPS O-acetylase OafA/YrhL